MGRFFQHHGKGILVNDPDRDLRLRLHAGAVGGQRKADGLPRLHAAVGQNGRIVCKKAAAMEFDRPGQLRGDGTPAQKAAQQHAVGFGWDIEKQLHPLSLPKNFTPYLNLLYQILSSLANLVFLWYYGEQKTSGTYGGGAALTALRKVRASQSTVTANGSRG